MNRLYLFIVFFTVTVSAFSSDWVVYLGGVMSGEHRAEIKDSATAHPNTYFMTRGKDGYHLFIQKYSVDLPDRATPNGDNTLRMIDENGKEIVLKSNSSNPRNLKKYPPSSDGSSISMRAPKGGTQYYLSYYQFDLEDIDEFLSHNYVGYSIYGGQIVVDLRKNGSQFYKKFNKSLKSTKKVVDRYYSSAINHKGDGMWID